jgi:hypothetical protein
MSEQQAVPVEQIDRPEERMDWSEAHDFVERYDLPLSCVAALATPARLLERREG